MTFMAVAYASSPTPTLPFSPLPSNLHRHHHAVSLSNFLFHRTPTLFQIQTPSRKPSTHTLPTLSCYNSESQTTTSFFATSDSDYEAESGSEYESKSDPFPSTLSSGTRVAPPLLKKRKRYRKEYPGENKGIAEEMRFVAMKLRNDKGSKHSPPSDEGKSNGVDGDRSWEPTMKGFVKYLVDSKLVFETLERVVEDSGDVSYAYFRKTGLERAEKLAMDLEWFHEQGISIPEPSYTGVSYATYLKELGEKSVPLFLSHFYNAYFSHITGGQVIGKQVVDKLVRGRELEFYKWEGDANELLKEVRVKLNMLSEHWSRDDKNKCLKEATKSFKHLGQIVRLIIL